MVTKEKIEVFPSKITEKKIWNLNNFFIALGIGLVIIISFFVILAFFDLNFLNGIILLTFFIIAYAIILFFLLEPEIIREISQTTLKTIKEEPIIKEIFVKKSVQIPYETENRIYITNPKSEKKLNIPKYDYIGSIQAGTYHKKICRLSKLIKKKYKVLNNDPNYFIKNNYKPCKICIKHLRKI